LVVLVVGKQLLQVLVSIVASLLVDARRGLLVDARRGLVCIVDARRGLACIVEEQEKCFGKDLVVVADSCWLFYLL